MATILAKNSNGKGIIIFTHNELEFFYPYLELGGIINKSKKSFFFKVYYFYYLIKNRIFKKNILKKINQIKKNYVLGVHWGFDINYIPKLDFIDFHLGFKKIENLVSEDFINLTSRNFSSNYMCIDNDIPKYWDFISVSSNQKRKNLIQILLDFRKLYDMKKFYSLLIIVPSTDETNDNELLDKYFKIFSYEERNRITIMKFDKNLGFLGLSQKQLSLFYKMSKIYISYSEAEGEPRTIHEAQLCGLPIVFFKNQLGGGGDYLDTKNTIFIDNFNNSHNSLITAYEKYDYLKKNTLINLNELNHTNNNIEHLKKEIIEIYKKNKLNYEELEFLNLDELNLRLPTHLYEYSSKTDFIKATRFSTGNIINMKQLNNFLNFIKI